MSVKHVCRVSLMAVVAISLALATAAENKPGKLSKVSIKNFGCINENYYRGAQPQKQEYAELASLGVKTVIDLQEDGEANEKQMVELAGMKFVRFLMNTTDRPDSKIVAQFLKLVDDPANQPVFVHCHGGRHRTGVMTAVYRLTHNGWTPDQAYSEMKQYEFGKGFGHGALKEYVYDYFASLDPKSTPTGKESIKAAIGDSNLKK
ncbi:MAG TPA: tyrosine-protein phosphatase [Blastocatellia bacterium]|nr:tyrosine-protein phosphatase [Blastocatellia bacterium]